MHGMWMNTRTRLVIFTRVPGHLDLVAEGTVSAGARGQKLEGVCWLSPFKAPLCFLNAPTADQIH